MNLVKRLLAQVSPRRSPVLCRPFLALCVLGLLAGGCQPPTYLVEVSHYDPDQVWPGDTFFQTHVWYPGYFATNMSGEVQWRRTQSGVIVGVGIGLDIMNNGNVLTMFNAYPTIINPMTDEILWEAPDVFGHHTIAEAPWGNVLTLVAELVPREMLPPAWSSCEVWGDKIVEIDLDTKELIWEWHLHEHLDPVEHHFEGMCTTAGAFHADWSHANTLKVIENYRLGSQVYDTVFLFLSRNLDTFFMIDYPSGDILWSFGQHGTFGRREPPLEPMFIAAHEIEMLPNGNVLLYDNGDGRAYPISRALEIAVDPLAHTGSEVWSWTDPDDYLFSTWGGDADRLPNGNTLISAVMKGRIVEVNPAGEKVWQLDIRDPYAIPPDATSYTMFMARRVPARSWE